MSDYGTPPPPPPGPPPSGGPLQPGPVAPWGAPLATWLQRVGGYLLDYVLYVPFIILAFIFMPKTVTTTDFNGNISTSTSGGSLALALLMYLVIVAIFIYNRCYLGGKGQSFGKKQVGLLLLAESTGQPIGTGKAFLRDVCHILDSMACYVGWLFPLWDAKRQTFADKIMTTVVPVKG
jgi:uncharacterized RDD family membrane protein YckC